MDWYVTCIFIAFTFLVVSAGPIPAVVILLVTTAALDNSENSQ